MIISDMIYFLLSIHQSFIYLLFFTYASDEKPLVILHLSASTCFYLFSSLLDWWQTMRLASKGFNNQWNFVQAETFGGMFWICRFLDEIAISSLFGVVVTLVCYSPVL